MKARLIRKPLRGVTPEEELQRYKRDLREHARATRLLGQRHRAEYAATTREERLTLMQRHTEERKRLNADRPVHPRLRGRLAAYNTRFARRYGGAPR